MAQSAKRPENTAYALRSLIDRAKSSSETPRWVKRQPAHTDEFAGMAMNNEKPPAEGQGLLRQTLVAGARSQCHYNNLSSMVVISGLTPAAA